MSLPKTVASLSLLQKKLGFFSESLFFTSCIFYLVGNCWWSQGVVYQNFSPTITVAFYSFMHQDPHITICALWPLWDNLSWRTLCTTCYIHNRPLNIKESRLRFFPFPLGGEFCQSLYSPSLDYHMFSNFHHSSMASCKPHKNLKRLLRRKHWNRMRDVMQ